MGESWERCDKVDKIFLCLNYGLCGEKREQIWPDKSKSSAFEPAQNYFQQSRPFRDKKETLPPKSDNHYRAQIGESWLCYNWGTILVAESKWDLQALSSRLPRHANDDLNTARSKTMNAAMWLRLTMTICPKWIILFSAVAIQMDSHRHTRTYVIFLDQFMHALNHCGFLCIPPHIEEKNQ